MANSDEVLLEKLLKISPDMAAAVEGLKRANELRERRKALMAKLEEEKGEKFVFIVRHAAMLMAVMHSAAQVAQAVKADYGAENRVYAKAKSSDEMIETTTGEIVEGLCNFVGLTDDAEVKQALDAAFAINMSIVNLAKEMQQELGIAFKNEEEVA